MPLIHQSSNWNWDGSRPFKFEDGLEKTVDWYLENEDWMNNITSGDYQKVL
jgi:dTDP-D-glucose 4,6-dehydratase